MNGRDLAIWTANAGAGTTWQMGDANYDGAVNGLDLNLWTANAGLPPLGGLTAGGGAPSGSVAVPEPGTLAMLAVCLLGLLE